MAVHLEHPPFSRDGVRPFSAYSGEVLNS
eukprot:COSAG01_NODE_55009_length_328_cov_0.711790_2_plen_29_part_01